MSKFMRLLLCAVMAAALAVAFCLGEGILRDRQKLRDLNRLLSESRAAWEDTAERKEALQEELKTVTNALKEARLTLEESDARAEELREEIAELEEEIARLREEGAAEAPPAAP